MVTVKCLHCDVDNDPRQTAGYCDKCGKKLPPASTFQRTSRGDDLGETIAESGRPRRQTAEALFTAAVLWLICGGLFLVLGPVFLRNLHDQFVPAVMLTTVGGLAWYGLLGLGARQRPRVVATIALIVFFLGWLATVIVQPATVLLTLVYAPVMAYVIKAFRVSRRERID